jgi:NitT/TauT family transport system substrate-binding protein
MKIHSTACGEHSRREVMKTLGKVALACLVSPCVLPLSRKAGAQPAIQRIRFGLQNTFTGASAVVWSRRKIYEKRGLKVEAFKFADGRAVRDAILGGKVDFGTMNLTPFFVGAAAGDFTLIAIVLLGGNTVGVFARPGIEKVADLAGKNVSITVGSTTGPVFVHQVGPALGLKEGAYRIVNLPPENQLPALVSGSVDAFAGPEPYLTLGEEEKAGKVLVRFGPYDANPTCLVVSTSFLEKHPDTVIAFLKSWLDGVDYWNANPDAAAEALLDMYRENGYGALTPELMKKLVSYPKVAPDITPRLVKYMKGQAEILFKAGSLKRLPDWDKVIRADLVEQARATRG